MQFYGVWLTFQIQYFCTGQIEPNGYVKIMCARLLQFILGCGSYALLLILNKKELKMRCFRGLTKAY